MCVNECVCGSGIPYILGKKCHLKVIPDFFYIVGIFFFGPHDHTMYIYYTIIYLNCNNILEKKNSVRVVFRGRV